MTNPDRCSRCNETGRIDKRHWYATAVWSVTGEYVAVERYNHYGDRYLIQSPTRGHTEVPADELSRLVL